MLYNTTVIPWKVVESDHIFKFRFESSLLYELNDLCLYITGSRKSNDISYNQNISDLSSGFEFEQYIANLLKKIGYSDVAITKSTGDYGVDVVDTKDLVTYALKSTRMTEALKRLKKRTRTTKCCTSQISAINRFGVYAAP